LTTGSGRGVGHAMKHSPAGRLVTAEYLA
jgi:hypothetical protein